MRRSKTIDLCSTYQISWESRVIQSTEFLPFTCAQPVIPGKHSSLRRCSGEYRAIYLTGSGLGPTRLISPRTTLRNCGSSSRLLSRKNFPKAVIRSSSGRGFPKESKQLVMVLNLKIKNEHPDCPARSWRNSTGEPSFIRTRIPINSNIGEINSMHSKETAKSSPRFPSS